MIVEKGNKKTISFLPTWRKENWKKSLPFSHAKREIEKINFSFYMREGKLKKSLFIFHEMCYFSYFSWIKNRFFFFMRKGKLEKISSLFTFGMVNLKKIPFSCKMWNPASLPFSPRSLCKYSWCFFSKFNQLSFQFFYIRNYYVYSLIQSFSRMF